MLGPGARRLVGLGCSGLLAAGCGAPPCSEAEAAGMRGAEATTFCELVDLIEGSDLDGTYQGLMIDCLAEEYEEGDRESVLAELQQAGDDELSPLLAERLVECDNYDAYWDEQDAR